MDTPKRKKGPLSRLASRAGNVEELDLSAIDELGKPGPHMQELLGKPPAPASPIDRMKGGESLVEGLDLSAIDKLGEQGPGMRELLGKPAPDAGPEVDIGPVRGLKREPAYDVEIGDAVIDEEEEEGPEVDIGPVRGLRRLGR